jgi:hypothetical protein
MHKVCVYVIPHANIRKLQKELQQIYERPFVKNVKLLLFTRKNTIKHLKMGGGGGFAK